MIAVIDYGAGNVRSVQNAFQRLGQEVVLSADHAKIRAADRVILPGVGDASWAMKSLKANRLDRLIPSLKQPVLGICLGLQLMCQVSKEKDTECLGIFNASVKRFPTNGLVPHMGWNDLEQLRGPLFQNLSGVDDFYFVHSYCAELGDETQAVCDYISPFSAALNRDNFYATQFHPEKSANVGNQLLLNFLAL